MREAEICVCIHTMEGTKVRSCLVNLTLRGMMLRGDASFMS